MSEWRYLAFRVDGFKKEVLVNGDLPLSEVSITKNFAGHSSLTAKISPEIASLQGTDGSLILRDWATVIVAMNGNTVHFAGFLHPTEEQGHTLTLSASSYSSYPTGQPYTASYRKYKVGIDSVIREIWKHLQGQTAGKLFLSVSAANTKETVGVKTYKTVEKTKTVTERVKTTKKLKNGKTKVSYKNVKKKVKYKAQEVDKDEPYVMNRNDTTDLASTLDSLCQQAGFVAVEKHKMSSTGVLTHTLEYLPQSKVGRKQDGLRFVVGENISEPLTVSGLGEDYASVVYVHGAGEGTSQIREGASMSPGRSKRIRRAVVISDTALKTRSLAKSRAEAEIESRNAEHDVTGQFTVIDHPNAPFGTIQIGDTIYIQNEGGWNRAIRQWCYVKDMTINCQDNTVQLTVEARERRAFSND